MTIVTELNLVGVPESAPIIQLPSPDEIALIQDRALTSRWLASEHYADYNLWLDDKFGIPATLRRGVWPPAVTGGLNGRAYLQLSSTTTPVMVAGSGGENLWPIAGGLTLAWVAKPSAAGNATDQAVMCVANNASGQNAFVGYSANGQNIYVRNGSGLAVNYSQGSVPNEQYIALSYDHADQSYVLYVNGVQVSNGTIAFTNTTTRLALFGAMTLTGSGVSYAGFVGQAYECLTYNVPIHKSVSSRTTLNTYMSAVYGLG